MRFKGKKWASPFFIISLAVAGLFGVTAGVLNKQVQEAPVVEKAEATTTATYQGDSSGWASVSMTKFNGEMYVLYDVTLAKNNKFKFKVDGNWWDTTSVVSSPSGDFSNSGTDVQYTGDGGTFDLIFFAQENNYANKLVVQLSGTKTIKILKQGNWTPQNLHYWVYSNSKLTTAWRGQALSPNYMSYSNMYYLTIRKWFDRCIVTDSSSQSDTFDISGDSDRLFFSKDTNATSVKAKSYNHNAGWYIFGNAAFSGVSAAEWTILGAKAATSTGGDNAAYWSKVSFTTSMQFKIGYYESNGSITYQNNGWGSSKAETIHNWFTWEDNKDAHPIKCNTPGDYKVYLNNSYYTLINKDVTITCKRVKDGTISDVGTPTGNSDILLSESIGSTFAEITSYKITGYYTNEACTTPVDIDATYPSGNITIYAKYEPKYSVITGDKVRVWVTYYASENDQHTYFDGADAFIKAWVHYGPDDNAGSSTQYIYDGYTGTTVNHKTDGGTIRFDYFDIDLACYTSKNSGGTTGWYLTLQRRNPQDHSQDWGSTGSIQLTSSNVGKIYSVYYDSYWKIRSENADTSSDISKVDTELAVMALCGLHTCECSPFNDYRAYSNYQTAFTGNNYSKLNDNYYGPLSDYYVYDYNSSSYTGTPTKVTNALLKSQWLIYEGGGPRPSGAGLGIFNNLFPNGNGEVDYTTLIIIIASSVSLLSITALSVLLVRKRKRNEQ